jgi:hypothetical protein
VTCVEADDARTYDCDWQNPSDAGSDTFRVDKSGTRVVLIN